MKIFTGFGFLFSMAMTAIFLVSACEGKSPGPEPTPEKFIIKAADLSFLPAIEEAGVVFYNRNGEAEDMLTTLKNSGMNTVRIRLWKDPENKHSGFNEVKEFAAKVKAKGMKVWLTVHYSDTWAEPGKQITPAVWEGLDFNVLNDSMYNYTANIVREIKPEYYQVGNEINTGILWPQGNISNLSNFLTLLRTGTKAVRNNSSDCKIIIHFAGIANTDYFFNKITSLDYDIIGLSYYPFWHGKDLNLLRTTIKTLGQQYYKQVVIAETAYPFTLGWNDWTNNIIGLEEQLLDDYPASPEGQKAFLSEIKRISTAETMSAGFAYWGAEWVSFKGPQATNGSSWENQAFYDFGFKALPVIDVFKD